MHLHFYHGKEQTQKAANRVYMQQVCMCTQGILKRVKNPYVKAQNITAHASYRQLKNLWNTFKTVTF